MGLTNEHVGPKIVAKIKIYVLTRDELLFNLCYEIPCKEEPSLKAYSIQILMATKKKVEFWNLDWFLRTDKEKKITFKLGTSI